MLVAGEAGKCEEQFQMVTLQLREKEANKGKTSQQRIRAAQTEMEAHCAGNVKL